MTNYERIAKDLTPEDIAHYLRENCSCHDCPANNLCQKMPSYGCYKIILAWCNMEEDTNEQ